MNNEISTKSLLKLAPVFHVQSQCFIKEMSNVNECLCAFRFVSDWQLMILEVLLI